MQNLQKQEISGNSLEPSSMDMPIPTPIEFETKSFKFFDVEFTERGNDVVYHFWPVRGELDFPPKFGETLEKAFLSVLPESADVRAEYMDKFEAEMLMRFDDDATQESEPVPTYYIRVVGWADNPMCDIILKNRVLNNLEAFVAEELKQ